ncbi:MAG: Subtilisin-like serine protease pepC [Amphiamblys sp. WSBS2006]|nr:MAG: Subtilisin-like serine protease pepC [Amphiamblys sp. WSBS2006]
MLFFFEMPAAFLCSRRGDRDRGGWIVVLGRMQNTNRNVFQIERPETRIFREHMVWLGGLKSFGKMSVRVLSHCEDSPVLGYSGEFTAEEIGEIGDRPETDYVERDGNMWDCVHGEKRAGERKSFFRRMFEGIKRHRKGLFDEHTPKTARQKNAPWGLCRISGKGAGQDGKEYRYPESAGKGVRVYVLDSGVDVLHSEFGGRAHWDGSYTGEHGEERGSGHGTHCAGIVGGLVYGVAKKTDLFSVKVLSGSGTGIASDAARGVLHVLRKHSERGGPSVVNMSFGGERSVVLEEAIRLSTEKGIVFVVAAGNVGGDACSYSPGRRKEVITVGACDKNGDAAFFSNNGKCVDVFGPGVDVLSSWCGGGAKLLSGTSMAAPHVAGVAALHLGEGCFCPVALKRKIINQIEIEPRFESSH